MATTAPAAAVCSSTFASAAKNPMTAATATTGIPTATGASVSTTPTTPTTKSTLPRRASKLLAPQQLPPPTSGSRNPVGRQVHQVEIRSGGTIAFRIPLWQKMAVGAFSGVLGTVTIFPIDTIKTRLQLASVQSNAGIRGIVQDVLGRYGVRGLYRGLPPTAVFVAPEKAIKLGVNDYLRDVLCGWDRTKETVLQQIAAGALTACVQVVVTNPMEIVKLRLQSAETSLTPFEAINELGLRGLYKGSAVTLARDIPYNVLFFLSYIYLKRGLTDQEGNISREKILCSGVAAGMVAACACTPFDVLKSRIQARGSVYTNGAVDCARKLYAEGGSGIFFRGAGPAVWNRSSQLRTPDSISFLFSMTMMDGIHSFTTTTDLLIQMLVGFIPLFMYEPLHN